jgi:HEAT repeat protein
MVKKSLTASVILTLIGVLIQLCGCKSEPPVNNFRPTLTDDVLEAQAGRIIREALASNEPQVRASVIETVAAIPINQGRNFMPDIQRLLKDEFVPVRFAAAVAIGDTGYTPAKGDVVQLLKDNDENVRLAASYAIFKLGGANASDEPIRKAISSSDQRVRANAAFLLGKTGDKETLPLLYQAISDEASDDRVRLNSIDSIARLGDERIYRKIWAMLISAYADDRVFGIQAMSALGTPQAKDAISTMLKDDLTEVRLVAAEQLGRLGDTSGERVVMEALTQGVNNTPDKEERARIETLAAMAIGQIKTATLKKFLPELLKNESQFVRMVAAKAIFQCAAPR